MIASSLIRRATLAWLALCAAAGARGEPGTVAMLRYGSESKSSICFASSFLKLASMEASVSAGEEFRLVALGTDELFSVPFAVMTGEGAFELTEIERENLRSYVLQGGFLLASAGCSSDAWAISMRRALGLAFPDAPLKELPLGHEVFHTLYDIREFVSRRRATVTLEGLEIGGRLGVIFSAQGLNDSAAAGVDENGASCCCCAGDEVLGARYLCANILLYALTR